ncbi:TPA: hypothetical protein I0H51_RS03750 [Enterococcus faecalis]|nr:hypothetical protein [Enterococcus faecalis]EEU81521.1 predicted protein [Enterococcus faecalis D6]EJU94162.1 hypothetical protein HMPREF1327_00058 [Enterococcus faecalis 599]EPH87137.1 hypothetical protein D924_00255 [Enterococcus faecalis 06-MB-S-10]EPH91633.1 hypothetical protein D923_00666 [Enterococcus faecalis 06-MB-S-04]MDO0904658.1 hypothetical protein [Enterococcus sp. A1(2023)]HAP5015776.1 hypothetical protein [Enterococcus faecalis EX166083VC26]HAP5029912.1 hypothetical protein
MATYGRIKRKRRKTYDFNFSAKKVTSLRPIYFYFVALHISNLLKKSQPIFSLATGLDYNHSFATTKNETLQSNFPVENLDNFGVFLFLYHFDAFFTFFKFFYLTIIYQKRASVPFIDGTLALLIIWRFLE